MNKPELQTGGLGAKATQLRCKPEDLQAEGERLWDSVTTVFDLDEEPHKLQILGQACRVADVIAELDEAAADAPLTVKGSMGQQVISPFIAEGRAQRAL